MIRAGRGCCNMPCESCAVQFSVFRRKRACSECERYYCGGCLRRGGGTMCAPCRVLSTRPLSRQTITHLKVRDLQCFLQRQNVSTRGCVEKEELVSLCVSHVNSAAYKRRGSRAGAFSSLKGLTNNINDFLNSAFDIRAPQSAPPPARSSCFNATHVHTSPSGPQPGFNIDDRRFTPTPGGERDVRPPVPEEPPEPPEAGGVSRSASAESARVDTADCFEIEDLDDAGWEFVAPPAEPLPNDSEILLTANEAALRSPVVDVRAPEETLGDGAREGARRLGDPSLGTPQRAASELELHRPPAEGADADSGSLQDEPLMNHGPATPQHISLERLSEAELGSLSVRQLKELLRRNRVEFRGCLERADLLQRARTLWREHARAHADIDSLPIEECCKICMAAPLECVLLECGHIAACTGCAKQLAECPICRQYVVRAVRFFRS
ncbi:unnamed protein product, partial [Iphiclides podalirius]